MHAHSRRSEPIGPGMPIRGTFYPSAARDGGGLGAALPRILAVVVGLAIIRTVLAGARHHVGHGGKSRRREALERLHRELHEEDVATPPASA